MRGWHLVLDENTGIVHRGPEVIESTMSIPAPAGLQSRSATQKRTPAPAIVINDTAVQLNGDVMVIPTTTEPPNVEIVRSFPGSWLTYHLDGQCLLRSVDPDDETQQHPAGPPADTLTER